MPDRFDGFTVTLQRDDDGDSLAHFAEVPDVSACGETPEAELNELAAAWGLKDSCAADGVAVPAAPSRRVDSRQVNVRIDKRLHKALAIEAAQAGLSLNALVSQKLAATTRVSEGPDLFAPEGKESAPDLSGCG